MLATILQAKHYETRCIAFIPSILHTPPTCTSCVASSSRRPSRGSLDQQTAVVTSFVVRKIAPVLFST